MITYEFIRLVRSTWMHGISNSYWENQAYELIKTLHTIEWRNPLTWGSLEKEHFETGHSDTEPITWLLIMSQENSHSEESPNLLSWVFSTVRFLLPLMTIHGLLQADTLKLLCRPWPRISSCALTALNPGEALNKFFSGSGLQSYLITYRDSLLSTFAFSSASWTLWLP